MNALSPGFTDAPIESQRAFRAVLDAMSRPGRLVRLQDLPAAPAPLHPATFAVALTLVDYETPLWLDRAAGGEAAVRTLRFHCGCPLAADPSRAAFALIADPQRMPPLSAFDSGTDEYPDRSATLIVQVPALEGGRPLRIAGPGILGTAEMAIIGLPDQFPDWVRDNRALFPRGVDIVFASHDRLAALPRSARIED